MADKKSFTKQDLVEIYKRAEAGNKWLAETDPNNILIMKSESRHIHDSIITDPRVDFSGKTTRWKLNTESEIIKARIASCREAYENAGIIANSIDLMVDFGIEGVSIVHENPSVQRFYMQWAKKVKLVEVLEQVMKSYFLDSNVPILSFRGRIQNTEVRRFRQAVASSKAQSQNLFVDIDPTRRRIIPYKYAVLDILRLYVEGADLLGNLAYEYDLEPEDKKRLKDPSEQKSVIMQRLRDAIGNKDFSRLAHTGRLRIDPARLTMLYYKRDGYRRWANPYIWRIIDDLRFKKLLRDMDISVVESVKNTLTIIGLGDTPAGFPATPGMLQKFASLLKTNTKSPYLIWNDLVQIIAEYPPVDKILGEEKYEQVNKDIRSALGIPEVILSGAGKGNFANSFLAVKTLIERLESARQAVLRWLEEQFLIVARAMDFKKPPIVRLRHMSLVDEQAQKSLFFDMVDRGMISYQTCIEAFGENFEVEMQRMKSEDKFRRKNEKQFPYTLVKTGKFGPSLSSGPTPFVSLLDSETLDNRQIEDADLKRERQEVEIDQMKNPPEPKRLPTQQGAQPNSGGRPTQTKKPQKVKTAPRNKPKGQDQSGSPTGKAPKTKAAANISLKNFEEGRKIFDKLYKIVAKALVKKYKLKDIRKLKDCHKEQTYDLVASIIGELQSTSEISKNCVETLLSATKYQQANSENLSSSYPKLNTEIRDTVRKIIRGFKKNNGYLPNKSEARDIISSVYAIS